MILDNKLNWNAHFKHIKDKCSKDLNLLKMLSSTTWGSDYQTIIKIYKTIIRSKIDYGCFIYNSARRSYISTLDPLQNTCLRLALGAFRTSPIPSLTYLSGTTTLETRRLLLLIKYSVNLWFKPQLNLHQIYFTPNITVADFDRTNCTIPPNILFFKFSRDHNFNLPANHNTISYTSPPWTRIFPNNINFELCIYDKESTNPKIIFNHFQQILRSSYINHNIIYTDGSKTSFKTGCAIYNKDYSKQCQLDANTSIFTAELHAIEEALRHISESAPAKWLIATDSLNALKTISKLHTDHPSIINIQNTLSECRRNTSDISLIWIPSHMGIEGNEQADTLAKNASERCQHHRFYRNDLYPLIRNTIENLYQLAWDLLENGNKLQEILPNLAQKPVAINLKRRDQTKYFRLLIGHTKTTHSYLLNREEPPICITCNTTKTVKHIFTQCKNYEIARIRNKIQTTNLKSSLRPEKENVENIIRFLKETDIYKDI